MSVADLVYFLCALTSLVCAVLLYRGWRATGTRLLFWSALCFTGFMLNNVLLIIDIHVLPHADLAVLRILPAVIGVGLLLYGLILDER